jgi:hypothetical protein
MLPIFSHSNADRAAPEIASCGDEAGNEILDFAPRFPGLLIERHANDLAGAVKGGEEPYLTKTAALFSVAFASCWSALR